jgi:hypothetical protein
MKIDYPKEWWEIGVGYESFEQFCEDKLEHNDPLICPPYHYWDDWDGLISQWELDED